MILAFNIFDRYIGKIILTTIMIVVFILTSISSIIKFVDQLKKIDQGDYNAIKAGIYTLFSVPKDLQLFFPMAALLGVLLGLGILVQRNELMVMQATGFTNIQISFSVMKIALPLVLLSITTSEWISPQGKRKAHYYRLQSICGNSLLPIERKLWIKDGSNFIYIEQVKTKNELEDITIYSFNKQHQLQSVRFAATAKYYDKNKFWQLSQVYESNFTKYKHIVGSQTASAIWATNLTPDKLEMIISHPDDLSVKDLYNYVQYLKSSNQNTKRYQLNMWKKIFQPLTIAVMMLMALSFVFGPLYRATVGVKVTIGMVCSFLFYIFDQICSQLTLIYNVSVIIGTLFPSFIFFSISLILILVYS